MKKIIIIMILIASATSCTPVNTTNVDQDKVDYGVIKQAQEKFENDSITPLVLVQTEDRDYLLDKNLTVVSEYDKDYESIFLVLFIGGITVGFLLGALIYI